MNTSPNEQAHLQQLANFMDSMGLLTDFVTFDPVHDDPSSVEADPQAVIRQDDTPDDNGPDDKCAK